MQLAVLGVAYVLVAVSLLFLALFGHNPIFAGTCIERAAQFTSGGWFDALLCASWAYCMLYLYNTAAVLLPSCSSVHLALCPVMRRHQQHVQHNVSHIQLNPATIFIGAATLCHVHADMV